MSEWNGLIKNVNYIVCTLMIDNYVFLIKSNKYFFTDGLWIKLSHGSCYVNTSRIL